MDVEEFQRFCLSFENVSEEFPFGPDTLVYKVGGKIFALAGIEEFSSFNLKCDPEVAIELRERYPCVVPGYHMNKVHWNTVNLDNSVSDSLLKEWITDSYRLVAEKGKGTAKPRKVKRKE